MSIGLRGDVKKRNVTSRDKRMSKERLMQWIALAANGGTIIGLLMVIMQLQQNRTLMRAQVRHELATTIVELLNSSASNGQLAGVVRRAGLGEQLTEDEQFQFRLRSNALLRYWEDVHYQYRLGLYDEVEYERQKAAWKATFANSVGFAHYWSEVRTLYSPRFASEIDGLQPPEPVKQLPVAQP
jgi:hypothetical protein